MKLKNNFTINNIGDNIIAVPVGNDIEEFSGIIKLNETAEYIFTLLNEEITYEELLNKVADNYSCEIMEAKKSVDNIIDNLKKYDLLTEL